MDEDYHVDLWQAGKAVAQRECHRDPFRGQSARKYRAVVATARMKLQKKVRFSTL
jgi:hypothetical protein